MVRFGDKTSWLLLGNDLGLDQNKYFLNVREHYQLETEHEQQTSVSKGQCFPDAASQPFPQTRHLNLFHAPVRITTAAIWLYRLNVNRLHLLKWLMLSVSRIFSNGHTGSFGPETFSNLDQVD